MLKHVKRELMLIDYIDFFRGLYNKGLCLKLLICCIMMVQISVAREIFNDSIPIGTGKTHFLRFGNKTVDQYHQGNWVLTPFLLPGYSPDIQFALTGGGLFSFKTRRNDSLLPRSTVPVTFTYSSTGAFVASSNWATYWLHDNLRINCLLQYRAMKDIYYGIGYYNAVHTDYPDSTSYSRSYFVFQLHPLWKVAKSLFAGPNLDYSQNILWNINPHMLKDANYQEFGQKIVNAGIGGTINYDTRDFPQNAYKGLYISATYTFYGKMMDGNTRFRALDVDSRLFLPLAHGKIRTLAFNWRSRYEFGEIPFTAMASLGSPFDLRGYRNGQFRDPFVNYGIAEYRHKFYTSHGKPTRSGFALWCGIGSIGSDFNGALFHKVLPDLGIGYRFEIQPRLNVRLDLGYSPFYSGIYFNIQEAF
jgi:hypothetical protein